jgi:hypothetical protein
MSCAIALWIALTPYNDTLVVNNEAEQSFPQVQCEQWKKRAGYEKWEEWRRTPMPAWKNARAHMQYVTCIPCENQAEHKARLYSQLPPFKLPHQVGIEFDPPLKDAPTVARP